MSLKEVLDDEKKQTFDAKISSFKDKNDEMVVHGYVRKFFADDWVDEIIEIIIQFYQNRGGSLYVVGRSKYYFGIEDNEERKDEEPVLVTPFDKNKTIQCAAGAYHALMVDIDGNLRSCGYGQHGQLGNGKEEDFFSVFAPQKLNLPQPVISVAVGHHHSLILLKNGQVQTFGMAIYGALGHGNAWKVLAPKTIEALKQYKIIRIAAGDRHSCALTEDGALFCFGENYYGQCGLGLGTEQQNILTPAKLTSNAVLMDCGSEHSLVIKGDGLIYSFGVGKCGRLGHGFGDNKYIPTMIEALKLKYTQKCAAGSYHSICLDKEGTVWAFGDNTEGQCGLGTEIEQQFTPKVIEYFVSNKIKAIDCAVGFDQSSVITEDGSLCVFGSNDSYQLGLKDTKNYFIPQKFPHIGDMQIKQVSMARTDDQAYTLLIA